ncbi:MAG: Spy/CpxP family protein refolding chaperone, partial [bacterium]
RLSDSPAVGGRVRLNKIDRILEARNDLNLMGAQISQLKTIKRDLRKQNIRLEAEIKIAEIELEELLGQSDVDIKAVEKKIREVEEAKTKKTIGSIKAEKRAKDILTERQKKIFSID